MMKLPKLMGFYDVMIRLIFILITASISLLAGFPAAAQSSLPEPNWSLAMANEAVGRVNTQEALKPLFRLAREGQDKQLLETFSDLENRSDWPVPAREHVLHAFASALGDLPAWTVSLEVIDYLENYHAQTLVPHGDHSMVGIPLYNIQAAAQGSANKWRRQTAAARAKTLLNRGSDAWLEAWSAAAPSERTGYVDALESATMEQLLELGRSSLRLIAQDPSLTSVAVRSALLLTDPEMLREAIATGSGPTLAPALRNAATVLGDRETLILLEYAITQAPPGNAALAIALLAPSRLDQAEMTELMFETLDNPKVGSAAALVLSNSSYPEVHQRLAEMASEKDSLASKRAALAIGNQQAEQTGRRQ